MKAWVDDRLVDADEARLHVDDHGVTTGDGCFETLKVVDGVAFALSRHLERLDRSCHGLGLPAPADALVREAVTETIRANGAGVGRLRITVTAGRAPLGSGRGTSGPTLTVLTGPAASWEPTTAVAVCPWTRNERSAVAGLKTTSYAENVVALAWAHQRGCSEAIFANTRGELCEGTGTNVFVVLGGTVCTPPLSSGCLPGVTRALVGEVVDVEERALPVGVLADADEVFVTSSTRDIQPVHAADGRAFAAPGPATAAAAAALTSLMEANPDP